MDSKLKLLIIFLAALTISSCATVPQLPNTTNIKDYARAGYHYFSKHQYKLAQQTFSRGLKYDPTNCQLNFLNALSYHMQGKNGDLKKLELASVGYKITMRYCPQDPWPRYYYGLLSMHQRNYSLAANLFEQSAMLGSGKHRKVFLKAAIIAAYNANDLRLARKLQKSLKKIAPHDKFAAEMQHLIPKYVPGSKKKSKQVHHYTHRSRKVERHKKKQLIVDAIIIVNDEVYGKTRGINLFDGLKVQYGGSYTTNTYKTKAWRKIYDKTPSASFDAVPVSSLITHRISIPDLQYSLDIFNDEYGQSQILSRPTLIAQDGEVSTFFSGRKLLIGVVSEDTAEVRQFPVGVSMKIKPTFQSDGSINLHITAGRDILIRETQPLTTFKELATEIGEDVSTTVNLHFGETAILSGLSEHDVASDRDSTPVLGNVPLVKNLFNARRSSTNYTSVLILLTPEPYKSFHSPIDTMESKHAQSFFNTFVDPSTNIPKLLKHLRELQLYRSKHGYSNPLDSGYLSLDAAKSETNQALRREY